MVLVGDVFELLVAVLVHVMEEQLFLIELLFSYNLFMYLYNMRDKY